MAGSDSAPQTEPSADLDAPASAPEAWLAEVAAAPEIPFPQDSERLPDGTTIDDHYVLEGVLGAGGMGVVYRARDLTLDRQVALKLHRWGNDRSRDRLLREAKVMAKLSHPNVLAVHEVGTWREHVYLAAELVEGATARQWQRDAHPWQQTVQLYIDAGRGLAAAHRIGLVHRDFKPDNVLVGEDGRVRVADFGLARPAGPPQPMLADETASASASHSTITALPNLTRTGARVGTPAYMAPEQFMGEELDGRADQFAFCVSLFEALFRERPFAGNSPVALAAAIGRGPVRAAGSSRVPRGLRAALFRGLQPEPVDRFASMDELLAELEAVLRPRRWLWIAGVAGVGGLAAAMAFADAPACDGVGDPIDAVWSSARNDELAAAITAPSDRSTWEAIEQRVDAYAEAWREASEQTCAERETMSADLHDRALACLAAGRRELDAELAALEAEPETRAMRALARLGYLVWPQECRDADFLLASVTPPRDASIRSGVDTVREEISRLRAGAWGGRSADEVLARADELTEQAASLDYPPLRAEIALVRGQVLTATKQPKRARPELENAYFLARDAGDHRVSTAAAMRLARLVGFQIGEVEPGRLWGRHAVTEARQGGVGVLRHAAAEHNLGILHDTGGDWARASELYQQALARLDPDDGAHDTRRAEILISVAALDAGRGRIEEAIATAEQAIEILRHVYGGRHVTMVPAIGNIGFALGAAGRYKEAYVWHERAYEILAEVHGTDHHEVTTPLINLAVAAHGMGDFRLARRHYRTSERIARAHFGNEHPTVAMVARNLALIAETEGKPDEAAKLIGEAVRIYEATHGPDAPETLGARNDVARLLLAAGEWEQGCPTFTEVRLAAKDRMPESIAVVEALRGDGRCAVHDGDITLGLERLEASAMLAETISYAPSGRATIALDLARAQWAGGHHETARATAQRAQELYDEAQSPEGSKAARAWLETHPPP